MTNEWMQDAACRDYDTDLFFPVKGVAAGRALRRVEAAKAICRRCPVINDCREYIFDRPRYDDDWGIYAGMTPEERHAADFKIRNERQRERRRQLRYNNK